MPSTADLLAIRNSREAGILGGLAALLASLLTTGLLTKTVGREELSVGLTIGALTVLLYVVFLVGLNLYRR